MEQIKLGKKGRTRTCSNGADKTYWQIIRNGKLIDAEVFDDERTRAWREGQTVEVKIKVGEWNQKVTYTMQLPKEEREATNPYAIAGASAAQAQPGERVHPSGQAQIALSNIETGISKLLTEQKRLSYLVEELCRVSGVSTTPQTKDKWDEI